MTEEKIKLLFLDGCMMAKPGQVLIDFSHHGHRYALLFTLPQQRQDIE